MHIKLKYGNTNTFFIRGMSGNLLVDTDYAGTLPAFYRAIKDCKIKISDITYILATHYHPDHIGLVSELMNQGVKLLVIDIQYSYIHFADSIFAEIRNWIMNLFMRIMRSSSAQREAEYFLEI